MLFSVMTMNIPYYGRQSDIFHVQFLKISLNEYD